MTLNTDQRKLKRELISHCFAGDKESSKDALQRLETLIGSEATPDDFTPHEDPTIAACLGKHFSLAAFFIEKGVTEINETTVSLAESELPYLIRVWEEQNKDGKVVALWNDKHLHVFQPNWLNFPVYKSSLVEINLSHNDLVVVPEILLWGLPELCTLDVSNNKLQCLPGPLKEDSRNNSSLKRLNVSHNQLCGVPTELFQLQNLETLELHNNDICSLDPADSLSRHHGTEEKWSCPNLKELDLRNNHLETLPSTAIAGASGLNKLRISKNNLTILPPSWRCPLETLEASKNVLETLSDMHQHWSLTLTTVDLSHNRLKDIPKTICRLTALDTLNVSNNCVTKLPSRNMWNIFKLHTLNLAANQLSFKDYSADFKNTKPSRIRSFSSSSQSTPPTSPEGHPDGEFDFLNALKDSLKHLDLSTNLLEAVPPSVCRLHRLLSLDLSGNEKLHRLPNELAKLKCLIGFKWPQNLQEPEEVVEIIQREQLPRKADHILSVLKNRLYRCEPYRGMKMIIVGPARGGKTAFVSSLIEEPHWPENDALVNTYKWNLTDPNFKAAFIKKKGDEGKNKITFTIWDLKGGDVYDTIQPCLYTDGCLYLVVWDGSEGAKSVENLKYYVADIKQRAPQSKIILVATHSDSIRMKTGKIGEELQNRVRKDFKLQMHLVSSSGTKKSPTDGIQALKNAIYQCAASAEMQFGKIRRDISHVVGRKIPRFILQVKTELEEMTTAILQTYILTRSRLQEKIHKHVVKDEDSEDILREALDFLSISGTVLVVKIRSGRQLIILDPHWLCRFLYEVTQINVNQLQDQLCRRSILSSICSKYGSKDTEFYYQLIEGLEVALPVDRNSYRFWIPAKLPKDKPAAIFPDDNLPSLRRYYKLPYTPPGFWVRLVSRLVVSLKKTNEKMKIARESFKVEEDEHFLRARTLSRDLIEDVVSGLNLKLKTWMYWQEGILVIHETGRILVEKHTFDANTYGISILVKSLEFREMGFVVDHIEHLIKDWYPGLSTSMQQPNVDAGDSTIKRIIPCPECADTYVHFYDVEDLTIAATQGAKYNIRCDCTKNDIPLITLIPDIFLNDLKVNVFRKSDLPHVEFTDDHSLGKGGFGEVYKATHEGKSVAVKTLLSTRLFNDDKSSALDTFEKFTLIENVGQFRSEVAMMSKLKHIHIVQMKWACIQMLAFAMEFAPEGDLSSVLEKRFNDFKKRHVGCGIIHDTVLDRLLTYKIVVQMASAVSYLHSNEMIYCDLKTDNALVFSMDPNDSINVKLTDYGISRELTGPGGFGDAGPPGFCAPEILKHDIFDNKADWFSFGMVLYHLLCGVWPYDDLERSERATATIQGIRPVFNFCGYNLIPSLPSLENLMKECWKDQPKDRPGVNEVIATLSDASMLCFRQMVPLLSEDKFQETAVFGMLAEKHMLQMWSRRDRKFVMYHQFDFESAFKCQPFIPVELPEADTSNVISVHMHGHIHVIETMSRELHIYEKSCDGRRDSNPVFHLQGKIPTVDPVESICYQSFKQTAEQQSPRGRLFIGFPRNRVQIYEQDDEGHWQSILYQKISLNPQQDAPCRNIQLLEDDTELWFSCGNSIVVSNVEKEYNFKSEKVNHQYPVVVNASAVITDMVPHAGSMWCHVVDSKKANCISHMVQVDIASRQCVRRLEFKGYEKVGDRLECSQDKLESIGSPSQWRTEDDSAAGERNRATSYVTCFRVTNSLVWVGTTDGKILIIDVSENNYGQVKGVFSLGNRGSQVTPLVEGETESPVRHLALIGDDKLIACQEVKGSELKDSRRQCSKYRLVVWDRWSLERFHWFDQVKQSLTVL